MVCVLKIEMVKVKKIKANITSFTCQEYYLTEFRAGFKQIRSIFLLLYKKNNSACYCQLKYSIFDASIIYSNRKP